MSEKVRCHCQSCMIRALTGPAIVITIGILLLLHQVHGGYLDFGNTWPVVLVVVGFLFLASSMVSKEGHIEAVSPIVPAPPGSSVSTVPPVPPQTPYSNQGQ